MVSQLTSLSKTYFHGAPFGLNEFSMNPFFISSSSCLSTSPLSECGNQCELLQTGILSFNIAIRCSNEIYTVISTLIIHYYISKFNSAHLVSIRYGGAFSFNHFQLDTFLFTILDFALHKMSSQDAVEKIKNILLKISKNIVIVIYI